MRNLIVKVKDYILTRPRLSKRKKEQKPIRPIPLTSDAQLERTRKDINATNRRRAKDMERRIAKYLQGERTPASGAMARHKGDITIDFVSNPGKYIIECKLSAAKSGHQSQIAIHLDWFAKIQQEAAAMRAKFGVLIIHYHGLKDDFVFVRSDHLDWIFTKSKYASVIDAMIMQLGVGIVPKDIIRFDNGKLRKLFTLEHRRIIEIFMNIDGFNVAAVNTPDGTYYIFELQQFRDLMEGI